MAALTLRATYATDADFLTAWDSELSKGGVLVRGATADGAQANDACVLEVQVAARALVEAPARVAAVVPGVGVAVMFGAVPEGLAGLAQRVQHGEAEAPAAAPPKGALVDRLKAMTVQEKMNLALSGSREERTALLRDPVKTLHLFVLKNPRIGLDEVQAAAKQPNLSPDALKHIAEHREWSGNATVCTALVRNPKTPLPLALRLLDKVPQSDLRAIAKGAAREQLVHAARKKVSG
jgi:hypothetical protein